VGTPSTPVPGRLNLAAAKTARADAPGVKGENVPPAGMTIGKKLTLWLLCILAGSILLLVLYLWRMDITAADDIRQNYGKDLNREDVALYLALRLQNFADALSQAGSDPNFIVSDKTAADEKALIETLNQFPSLINNDAKVKLDGCVATLSATGTDRKTTLQPCIDAINKVRTEGMTTAAAAFSFQMASEASSKLLEQRQSLHEFWLKAAQLILLNLLLPVLTAALGYTFGHQQAQQQQGTQ
jgi:hypothetical protein